MPKQQNPALLGLQRAFARDVPEGYEGQSAWQANQAGVNDQDLMRLYRQRQQDRIDAENRSAAPFTPMIRNSFNFGGFNEGLAHNDLTAGIGSAGDVVADPRTAKVNLPMEAFSTQLGQGQADIARTKQYVPNDPQAASFSLRALQTLALNKALARMSPEMRQLTLTGEYPESADIQKRTR